LLELNKLDWIGLDIIQTSTTLDFLMADFWTYSKLWPVRKKWTCGNSRIQISYWL